MLTLAGLWRSRRLRAAAFAALVAECMLATLSPTADVHYHDFSPLHIRAAAGQSSAGSLAKCPECTAMQQVAVPGAPVHQQRISQQLLEVGILEHRSVHIGALFTPKTPRAPPSASLHIHKV